MKAIEEALRVIEIIVLMLISGAVLIFTRTFFLTSFVQPVFWDTIRSSLFFVSIVWGMASLWLLVFRIRPETASKNRGLPWLIWIGLILGGVHDLEALYDYTFNVSREPQISFLIYACILLPVVILMDRLRVLWYYRHST